ncbi:MAG: HNH endonuclease signature motif containing protein [Bacteroidota bacterium]
MPGKKWTVLQDSFLILYYSDEATSVLAKKLGRSTLAVYEHAQLLGLHKSKEYMKSDQAGRLKGDTGIKTRFKKGVAPWNKGLHYNPKNGTTRFKKGNKPMHTAYDGAISVRSDNGREYKYIRITESHWIPLHVKIWTDANGPVPDGFIVVFKNQTISDREKLDNLELISRAENMKRNTLTQYPPELRQVIKTLNNLKNKLHEQDNTK